MKFQNPSFNFFNGLTHGRINGQMHARTDKPKQYAPHFFKVEGIIIFELFENFQYIGLNLVIWNCTIL